MTQQTTKDLQQILNDMLVLIGANQIPEETTLKQLKELKIVFTSVQERINKLGIPLAPELENSLKETEEEIKPLEGKLYKKTGIYDDLENPEIKND